jgi:hypothetical protein
MANRTALCIQSNCSLHPISASAATLNIFCSLALITSLAKTNLSDFNKPFFAFLSVWQVDNIMRDLLHPPLTYQNYCVSPSRYFKVAAAAIENYWFDGIKSKCLKNLLVSSVSLVNLSLIVDDYSGTRLSR